MSDEKRAADLMAAYDPMWNSVMDNTILLHVPEQEREQVKTILLLLRNREIMNALKYARKSGSPKQSRIFLNNIREYASGIATTIPSITE